MRNLKVILAMGGGLLAAVVVACSSSSNPPAAVPDAGMVVIPVSDAAMSCIPITTSGLCPSAQGLTCCLDLSAGFSGTCVPQGQCTQQIQVACTSQAQCGASQVCCADFGGADAGTLAALEDSGLGALGIDASAINLDAGAAGLGSILGNLNINFKVTCATSCSGGQIQACATSAECVGGGTCVPLMDIIGDAGLGGGDAGALPAGFSSIVGSLGMEKACVPPDAGTTPVADSGSDTGATSPEASVDGSADATDTQ
jgi:hypothetical protein